MQIEKSNIEALKAIRNFNSIENDFAVITDINKVPLFYYPTRMACLFFATCIKG